MGDDTGRDYIWTIYDSLHEQQAHLGNLQAGVRGLASVWLLTGLGATAYLVRTPASGQSLRMSSEFALAAVCSLVAMGLAVLWMIDQLIYQGFLDAIFVVALKLEHDHCFLPPVRTVIALNANKGRSVRSWLSWFYFLPISIFLLLGAGAAFADMGGGPLRDAAWVPVAVMGSLAAALFVLVRRMQSSPHDRAPDFEDDDFRTYVSRLGCETSSARSVLRRFNPRFEHPPATADRS